MHKEIDLERLATRIIASVVLIAFSVIIGAVRPGPLGVPGKALAITGLVILAHSGWQLWMWWQKRADPYELSKLFDEAPTEPEEPLYEADVDALALCHRCGCSMPRKMGICPECGNSLGS